MTDYVEVTVVHGAGVHTARAEFRRDLFECSIGPLSIASALQGAANQALMRAAALIDMDRPQTGRTVLVPGGAFGGPSPAGVGGDGDD